MEREGNLAEGEVRIVAALVREAVKGGSFPPVEAEDLIQEALLHWWRIRSRYRDRPGGSVRAYLRTSVRRFLKDQRVKRGARKRAKAGEEESLEEEEGAPAKDEGRIEERLVLTEALRDLDPFSREVAERLSMSENPTRIAETLGASRQRVYRAIERIRAVLTRAGFK